MSSHLNDNMSIHLNFHVLDPCASRELENHTLSLSVVQPRLFSIWRKAKTFTIDPSDVSTKSVENSTSQKQTVPCILFNVGAEYQKKCDKFTVVLGLPTPVRHRIDISDSTTTIEYCRMFLPINVIIQIILETYVPLPKTILVNVPGEHSTPKLNRPPFIVFSFSFRILVIGKVLCFPRSSSLLDDTYTVRGGQIVPNQQGFRHEHGG